MNKRENSLYVSSIYSTTPMLCHWKPEFSQYLNLSTTKTFKPLIFVISVFVGEKVEVAGLLRGLLLMFKFFK